MKRIFLPTVGAAAIAMAWPSAVAATCAVETFGAVKEHVCKDQKCGSFAPPEEMQRITRGIHTEYIGLFVNDGFASWLGLDLDKSKIVELRRFAGPHVTQAPRVEAPNADNYRRETKKDQNHWIDVVRTAPVRPDGLGEIVCLANQLWKSERPPFRMPATDVHNALYLVDGGAKRVFGGGPGNLIGAGQALGAHLQKLRDPAW